MDEAELSPTQREALIARVRSEVQEQAMRELTTTITKKCYEKCVTRPGNKLDSKSQQCLAMCMDRYIETMQVVSQSIMKRGSQ